MPRRTNDFQRLVHMLQQAFAPKGAKVTESAPLPGRATFREVDVLFEGLLGPYSLKIAIEATKTSRKLDGPAIEKFIGKYSGSDIDKVVVVARGFTKEARRRAEDARIQLWSLVEAEQSDWTRLAPTKFQLHLPPHVCDISVTPTFKGKGLNSGKIICSCCGKSKGTVAEYGQRLLKTQVLQNSEIIAMMNQLVEENKGVASFKLAADFPKHKLQVGRVEQDLIRIEATIHYIRGHGDAIWSTYKVQDGAVDRTVDQMEVKVAGKHVRLVFPEGPKSPKVVLRIDQDESFKPNSPNRQPTTKKFSAMPWNQHW